MYTNLDSKKISQRINRIIGQLKGIERMIEEGRECGEILVQFKAVKKAIDGLSKEVVISDLCKVVPSKNKREKLEKTLKAIVDL